jgi:phosphatidylglycerophosphatase C
MNDVILIDFDGTITSRDSTKILIFQLLLIRPWRVFALAWYVYLMILSNDNIAKQKHKNNAIGYLIAGLTENNMDKALVQFSNKVKLLFRPLMLQKIKDSCENGTTVLIVTASPTFAIRYCVSDLSVSVIGTEFEKNGTSYCGKIINKVCFGVEKVKRVELWKEEAALDCTITEAWSDDFSDYPMMTMAKQRFWVGGSDFQKIINLKDPNGNFVDCSL